MRPQAGSRATIRTCVGGAAAAAVLLAGCGGGGGSAGSGLRTETQPPPAIDIDVRLDEDRATGRTRVRLSWTKMPDADEHRVLRGDEEVYAGAETIHVDNLCGGQYVYQVEAFGQATLIAISPEETVSLPPNRLTGVTARLQRTGSSVDVVLGWPAANCADGYRVYRNGVEITMVAGTSYTDADVGAGIHSYQVAPFNAGGQSDLSPVATVLGLEPPAALAAEPIGRGETGRVELSWRDASDADGYLVYRDGKQIADVADISHTDAAVGAGAYSYRVAAYNAGGRSGLSPAVSAVLGLDPPAGLAADPVGSGSGGSVSLSWQPAAGADGYVLFRDGVQIADVAVPSYIDAAAGAGTHSYRIAAYNSGGQSDFSPLLAATVPELQTPAGLAAAPVGPRSEFSIQLSWRAVGGAGGYRVFRDGAQIADVAVTSYTDAAAGTGTHAYQVASYDADGESALSPAFAAAVPDLDAPAGLTAQPVGSGSEGRVTLHWQPVPEADGYLLFRDSRQIADVPLASYYDPSGAGAFTYWVVAYDAGGQSELSPQQTVRVPALGPPGFVTAKPVRTRSAVDVELSWVRASDAEGYGVIRDGNEITRVGRVTSYIDRGVAAGTYRYGIVSYGAVGSSSPGPTVQVVVHALDAPAAFAVATEGSGSSGIAHLSWQAVGGADGYRVYRDGVQIADVQATEHTDAVAGPGAYSYEVAAYDAGGDSDRSPALAVTLPELDSPLVLAAVPEGTGSAGSVRVQWRPVAGASGYRVWRDGSQIADVAGTVYTDAAVGPGSYAYQVAAYDSSGQSALPAGLRAIVPNLDAPTGLAAASDGAGSAGSVRLSWQAVGGADGYRVFRDSAQIAEVAGTVFADAAVGAGTFSYQVVAYDAGGQSDLSPALAAAVPFLDQPSGLSAVPVGRGSSGSVQLSWQAVGSADGYRVFRDGAQVATVAVAEYTDAAVGAGTFSYQVVAYDAGGQSERSLALAAVVPLLGPPADLAAVPDGSGSAGSVRLSWQAVGTADGYRVFRDGAQIADVTGTDYTDAAVGPGTFEYQVVAYDASGPSARGPAFAAAVPALDAPAGLAVTPIGIGSAGGVQLSWLPVGGADGYLLFRDGAQIADVAGTEYTDSAIGPGTYDYQLVAYDASGQSGLSPRLAATVFALDPPDNLAAVPEGTGAAGSVRLSWRASSGAEGYLVFREGTQIADVAGTSYTDAAVGAGAFNYWVIAYNAGGQSNPSAQELAAVGGLPAPEGLAAVPVSGSGRSLLLTWQPVAGAEGYRLYRGTAETVIADVAGTSYTHTSLKTKKHRYRVAAYQGATESARSPELKYDLNVLDTPAALHAQAIGSGAAGDVRLKWAEVEDAASYRVLRDGLPIADTPATEHTDEDVGTGTYRYQVIAYGADFSSEPTPVRVAAVPAAPVVLDPGTVVAHVDIPPPNPSDGHEYRTHEFLWSGGYRVRLRTGERVRISNLEMINAHKAYQRGYFGQGVTVGVYDSGFDLTHFELAPNILPGLNTQDPSVPFEQEFGHGSRVAGIVAAARDGNRVHGVAPAAKVFPYEWGNASVAFRHAVENGIPIVNNSWGIIIRTAGRLELPTSTITISLALAVGPELLDHPGCEHCSVVTRNWESYKDIIADQDIVLVWAAGNEYFNSDSDYGRVKGCEIEPGTGFEGTWEQTRDCERYSTQEIIDGFTILPLEVEGYSSGFHSTIRLATVGLKPNSIDTMAAGPNFHPEFLGRWVVATGVTPDKRIYYNGCGSAKHYCLVAPAHTRSIDAKRIAGTSYAAPHVSGALAILKSRLPHMPMYAVLAILFHTAEDLGEPGTDEVFGRGLVDLDHATSVQGSVAIVFDDGSSSGSSRTRLTESAVRLSPALRALKRQTADISVAVNFLDSYYYGMPLAGLLAEPAGSRPKLGGAAADMLSSASEVQLGAGFAALADSRSGELNYVSHSGRSWRLEYEHCRDCADSTWREYRSARIAAPFFAAGGQAALGEYRIGHGWSAFGAIGYREQLEDERYRQAGLRWQSAHAAGRKWSGLLELSRSVEDDALYGAEFEGALAIGDSATYQARVGGELALDDSWLLALSATAGWTEASTRAGSMIADISDLRFAGWRAYIEGRSLLRTNDALRIGIVGQTQVAGGSMVLRHAVVDGEAAFSEEHYMNLNSEYAYRTTRVDLEQESDLIAQIGYVFGLGTGMRTALGIESAAGGEQGSDFAASFELRWDL